jgi:hypothetical protein
LTVEEGRAVARRDMMSPQLSTRERTVISFDDVRTLALALPGVEEGTSFGTPAFRVKKKLLARLREDGELLVLKCGFFERDALIAAEPETFLITPHYQDYPAVLVRLSLVHPDEFRDLLIVAWRSVAPARLVAAYDEALLSHSTAAPAG